jgi:hypothetical protein
METFCRLLLLTIKLQASYHCPIVLSSAEQPCSLKGKVCIDHPSIASSSLVLTQARLISSGNVADAHRW